MEVEEQKDNRPIDINLEEYDGRLVIESLEAAAAAELEECANDFDDDTLVLSPRQAYPKPDALENFFICKVCLKVINEPKECSTCQTAFCASCIDQWIKSKSQPNHRGRVTSHK
jgi:hypothetical protein